MVCGAGKGAIGEAKVCVKGDWKVGAMKEVREVRVLAIFHAVVKEICRMAGIVNESVDHGGRGEGRDMAKEHALERVVIGKALEVLVDVFAVSLFWEVGREGDRMLDKGRVG